MILLKEQINRCILYNRVDQEYLTELYEESDDQEMKMHLKRETFKEPVRDFTVKKVAIEAARRFVEEQDQEGDPNKEKFLDGFVDWKWRDYTPFQDLFDKEHDRLMEHKFTGTLHAKHLLY